MLQKVSKVILMALVILFAVPNLAIYAQEQETETPPSIQSVIEPSQVSQTDEQADEPRSNRSKRIVETVADVINTVHSAKQFYKEPSRTNGALLAWDVISIAVPGVPGS